MGAIAGVTRARERLNSLDEADIDWQIEIIRQSICQFPIGSLGESPLINPKKNRFEDVRASVSKQLFETEANSVFDYILSLVIRSGPGAAWLGFDWLGDSEVSRLAPLGDSLYNGTVGIAVFLAGYAKVTGSTRARDLAVAAIAGLRKDLNSSAAVRIARGFGTGGATGLGSIVYGLTTIANILDNREVLSDAAVAAKLFSDDLISSDKALDVVGGNAGAILGLLRLYRATQSADVLARAVQCGDHILSQGKFDPADPCCSVGNEVASRFLNGMSHGGAGFAYSLASLAQTSGQMRFRDAAYKFITIENSSFSVEHNNWPDFRTLLGNSDVFWTYQWCHGAPGIGMARLGMLRIASAGDRRSLQNDVERALRGVKSNWPNRTDTLCCGTLGSIEFLNAAGQLLQSHSLRDLAAKRLAKVVVAGAKDGFVFGRNNRRFNVGLFQGVAGVGYTVLRQLDESLPNVLLWE